MTSIGTYPRCVLVRFGSGKYHLYPWEMVLRVTGEYNDPPEEE